MGDGRWEMGDGKWEMGDGRWEMGDGRFASRTIIYIHTLNYDRYFCSLLPLPSPNSHLPSLCKFFFTL
jgi:hypothetical protein